MSSTDLLQAQSPNQYGAWTNIELINEPAFLDEFGPQLNEPFDFSLDVNGQERQRVDSVTESLSSTTSTATDPKCEPAYSPSRFTYGYQDLWINGQTFPDPDSHTPQVKFEPLAITSYSWDTDCAPEDVSQRLECPACSRTFSNLRALDRHTQSTSHKAWRCREPGCGKSYARRDTFLRHRSKHSDNSHSCLDCLREGKEKVFKRKDHLNEHIRSCHSKVNDGTRSVQVLCRSWTPRLTTSIRANNDHANDLAAGATCSRTHSQASVDSETPMTPQQQAMKDLVKSLNTVLGDRHPNLIGKLDRMSALSGPDMESVAESMAISALAKTYFSNPEQFVCPYAKSEP
jgi:hypothetical protein